MSTKSSCPSLETLRLFALGELQDAEIDAVGTHLSTCPSCVAKLESLGARHSLIGPPRDAWTASFGDQSGGTPDDLIEHLQNVQAAPGAPQPAASTMSGENRASTGSDARTTAVSTLPIPAVPGHEILRILGRGGMGVVYLARHQKLDRLVALKMILGGGHADPAELARFQSEAEAVARLQHPNIVQIYEVGEANGLPFFSLEYVAGGTLAQRIYGTPQAAQEAARLAETLARAMDAAHAQGIVHRDLKPANVLLTQRAAGVIAADARIENAIPKITDFGLAKHLNAEAGQTRTGAVMGTPPYMAPEQAEGKTGEIGPLVDVYALGAILYELLTGRPPFKGPTALDTIKQVIGTEPVPPRRLQPTVPRDLETICLKCLHKEPARRYDSGLGLAQDLRRFQLGEPILARPVGQVERMLKWVQRRPMVAGLAAAVALVAAIGTGAFAWAFGQALDARNSAIEKEKETKNALVDTDNARKKATDEKNQKDKALALLAIEKGRAEHELHELETTTYHHNISDADIAIRNGDFALARERLDDCQWNLRGPEYGYLANRIAQTVRTLGGAGQATGLVLSNDARRLYLAGSMISILDLDTGKVILKLPGNGRHMVPAENGKRLYSAESDRISVWELETGKEVFSLPQPDVIRSMALDASGKRLFSGGQWAGGIKVWDLEKREVVMSLGGGNSSVSALAMTKDSKKLYSAAYTNTITIWDTESGKEVGTLRGHPGRVSTLTLSPDGKRLLSGDSDGQVKVWDLEVGKEVVSLRGHTKRITSLSMAGNGKRLCSASGDETIKVWNLDAPGEVLTLRGHRGEVLNVALTEDGSLAYSVGDGDNTVKVWNMQGDTEFGTLRGHTNAVYSLVLAHDGKHLCSGGIDKTIKVWDVNTRKEITSLRGHTSRVDSLVLSPDGKRLYSGAVSDTTIRVWDLEKGKELDSLPGHPSPGNSTQGVRSLVIADDGKRLVSAGFDGTIKVWDLESRKEILSLDGRKGVSKLALSSDGKRLISAEGAGTKVWDIETAKVVLSLPWATHSLVLTADGKRLFRSGSDSGSNIYVVDLEAGTEVTALLGQKDPVIAMALTHDGKRLFTAGLDGSIRLWDVEAGKEILTLHGHSRPVFSLVLSTDGKQLFSACQDSTIRVWNLAAEEEALTLRAHNSTINCMALAEDGKRLYFGCNDRTIRVWDLEKGKVLKTLRGHTHIVLCLAISKDGKRLFSGCNDKTVKVWDLEAETEVLTLRGHSRPVTCLALMPDGKRLLSGSADKTIKVWDLEAGREVLSLADVEQVFGLAVARDGKHIYAGTENTIKTWDMDAAKIIGTASTPIAPVAYLLLEANESRLYAAGSGDSQHVRVLDAETRQEILTLKNKGPVTSLAVAKDGKLLYAGVIDGTVTIWDAVTGREIGTLPAPMLSLCLVVSRDGKRLFSGGGDGTITLWQLSTRRTIPIRKAS